MTVLVTIKQKLKATVMKYVIILHFIEKEEKRRKKKQKTCECVEGTSRQYLCSTDTGSYFILLFQMA